MRMLSGFIVILAAVTVAHSQPVIDPGSIEGVQGFTHVRAVVGSDAAVMAWLSGDPFVGGQIFATYAAAGENWGPAVQVSGQYSASIGSDGGAGEFSLVRASNGAYWLAWSADTGRRLVVDGVPGGDAGLGYLVHSPDIWVASSSDGRTWSAPQPVAVAPTPDRDPGIIETTDGRIGVIWVSARDGNEDLSLTFRDSKGEFGQAVQITSGASRNHHYELGHVGPKYLNDSRGTLTLAWVSDRTGEPQVWTAVSSDGRTWSQPVQVSGVARPEQAQGASSPEAGSGAALAQPRATDVGFLTIEDLAVGQPAPAPNTTPPGYNLYWSVLVGEEERRWVSHSADFVAWSEPELAPQGK